jgi:hypothetical protein
MIDCTIVEPPGTYPLTFLIKDIEPEGREWREASEGEKRRFYEVAGIIAEKVKQSELQKGLDRHGRKLKPVRYRKVRFRRTGKRVDGEPLMPHRALSRTRRLLKYTITSLGILFYWQNGWAKILDMHRRGACIRRGGRVVGKLPKRDVFGISPAGIQQIKREALSHWRRGTMPNKKISPIMEDKGLGIELPFDSGTDKKTGKPVKPVEQWDVEDFLAAGVNVFRNTSKSRVRNTATGTPGLRDTGITVKVDFKNWNFAK